MTYMHYAVNKERNEVVDAPPLATIALFTTTVNFVPPKTGRSAVSYQKVYVWHCDVGHPLRTASPAAANASNDTAWEEDASEVFARSSLAEVWNTMQIFGITNNLHSNCRTAEEWVQNFVTEVLLAIGIKDIRTEDDLYMGTHSEKCFSVITDAAVRRRSINVLVRHVLTDHTTIHGHHVSKRCTALRVNAVVFVCVHPCLEQGERAGQ